MRKVCTCFGDKVCEVCRLYNKSVSHVHNPHYPAPVRSTCNQHSRWKRGCKACSRQNGVYREWRYSIHIGGM